MDGGVVHRPRERWTNAALKTAASRVNSGGGHERGMSLLWFQYGPIPNASTGCTYRSRHRVLHVATGLTKMDFEWKIARQDDFMAFSVLSLSSCGEMISRATPSSHTSPNSLNGRGSSLSPPRHPESRSIATMKAPLARVDVFAAYSPCRHSWSLPTAVLASFQLHQGEISPTKSVVPRPSPRGYQSPSPGSHGR